MKTKEDFLELSRAYTGIDSSIYVKMLNLLERNGFFTAYGSAVSATAHHCHRGGLADHTYEVIKTIIYVCPVYNITPNNIMLYSATMHDYGKIFDYDWNGTKSEHCRNIHHISRSAIEWGKLAQKHKVSRDIEDKVTHCILSHHMTREAGSPVAPKSREAWLLTLCDNISARMSDWDKFDVINCRK